MQIDGETWTEVRHFQESDSDSLHFTTDTNALDVSEISFGNGQFGAIPAAGKTLFFSWLESLGADGNIAPNRITQLLSPIYHENVQVLVTISNPVAATGGSSRESIQHAKVQAPAELSTLWKAVSLQDYKALAEGFPGVAKAKVLDTNDCRNIRYYTVHLAIAPSGGGLPSGLLKRDLANYLEQRKVATVEVKLFDPVYQPIPIDCTVYAWPGEELSIIKRRIETALGTFFSFDRVDFAQTVHTSDLVALIDGVRGVSHLQLNSPQTDVELKRGEIPVLGIVNIDLRRGAVVSEWFQQNLINLLPPLYADKDEDGDLRTFLSLPAGSLDELKASIDQMPGIFDVDRCDERFLPLLAYLVGHTYEGTDVPENQRRLIREAVEIYRRKGTLPAMDRKPLLHRLGGQY